MSMYLTINSSDPIFFFLLLKGFARHMANEQMYYKHEQEKNKGKRKRKKCQQNDNLSDEALTECKVYLRDIWRARL